MPHEYQPPRRRVAHPHVKRAYAKLSTREKYLIDVQMNLLDELFPPRRPYEKRDALLLEIVAAVGRLIDCPQRA